MTVVKTFQNRQAVPNNPASSSDYNTNGDELDVDLDAIIADLNNALLKTGGTMEAALNMGFFQINDLATPSLAGDAATKGYVDSLSLGLDWQNSVLDKDLTAPPGSPSTGDRYIVGPAATGAWATHDEKITEFNGSTWDFITPNEGFACWVEDEDVLYVYNGEYFAGNWVKFGSTLTHANLLGLLVDDHTIYAFLAGRAGGQTIIGGTDSGDDLVIESTSHATKGDIVLQNFANAVFKPDGTNARFTIADSGLIAGIALDMNGNNIFGGPEVKAEIDANNYTLINSSALRQKIEMYKGGNQQIFIVAEADQGQIIALSPTNNYGVELQGNDAQSWGNIAWWSAAHQFDIRAVDSGIEFLTQSVGTPIDIKTFSQLDFTPNGTNSVLGITASGVLLNSNALNTAGGLVELDGSADVPLDQIPDTLTGKDADTVDGADAGVGPNNVFKILSAIAQGDILYVDDTPAIARLPAGTSGKVLKSQGAAANPIWGSVITFDTTTVFSGVTDNSQWSEIDMSGTIGAKSRIVLLKVRCTASPVAGETMAFRKEGDDQDFVSSFSTNVNGCHQVGVNIGESGYVIVPTSSSGKIDYRSSQNATVTVSLEAYI